LNGLQSGTLSQKQLKITVFMLRIAVGSDILVVNKLKMQFLTVNSSKIAEFWSK
jgi:hypothetical protein